MKALVNALAMMSPFGPPENRQWLEAPDLKRALNPIAVTERISPRSATSGDPPLP